MFPYREENQTHRPPYITTSLIVVNIQAWLFV